jgi:acetylornithine/succinyldiaminopimelate/putrescine aminotransferase
MTDALHVDRCRPSVLVEPTCATIGFTIPPDEYFAILREICDEFKIL